MKRTANISVFLQPLRDKPYQALSEGNELYQVQKGAEFLW